MALRLVWLFVLSTIGLHILWPLTTGDARIAITSLAVVTFALASVIHAALHAKVVRAVFALMAVAAIGFAAEYIGSTTGVLFGEYDYTSALQPQIAGVPVIVLLAWFMMVWPLTLLSLFLVPTASMWLRASLTGFMMMSWDFFLDPQMVGENYWVWSDPGTALPGIDSIPLFNYACWWLIGALASLAVDTIVRPHSPLSDVEPMGVMILWTWFSGVVGHAFFWARPGAALWGGLAFSLFMVPALRKWISSKQ